ncbi:MAG: hypothetical protein H7Y38_12680 [Armatimonadetes bacterium]|nr:hypothetical protein [Armatimonadota bacterium]
MTAETYMRRALLAPILVPILAAVPLFTAFAIGSANSVTGSTDYVTMFLFYSLLVGGIPYVWMYWAKRQEMADLSGEEFEVQCKKLPLEMLPYFWKFWTVITLLLIPTGYGVIAGLGVLAIGTVAVIVLGYAYVAVTFAFLRGFQWLRLVE